MLSSRYDQPQTPDTLSRWLREEGLEDRSVERVGFLVGRGRTPAA